MSDTPVTDAPFDPHTEEDLHTEFMSWATSESPVTWAPVHVANAALLAVRAGLAQDATPEDKAKGDAVVAALFPGVTPPATRKTSAHDEARHKS